MNQNPVENTGRVINDLSVLMLIENVNIVFYVARLNIFVSVVKERVLNRLKKQIKVVSEGKETSHVDKIFRSFKVCLKDKDHVVQLYG